MLSREQIEGALAGLSGWRYADSAIQKQFQFADFRQSMAFVNRVADLAEAANHHPDITINYSKVLIVLSSHDAGGVTQRDLNAAREIESSSGSR